MPLNRIVPFALRGAACAVAVALVACAGGRSARVCAPIVDGVRVVENSGPGAWQRSGLEPRLVELWRAGGLREGEGLAMPAFPAASRDGRLAVPDFRLGEVVVLGSDGEWLGPWTRSGEGPGEIGRPVAGVWDDGGRLAVFDIAAPKVVHLADGAPVADDQRVDPSFTAPVVTGGALTWAGVQPSGATLLYPPAEPVHDGRATGRHSASILRLPEGGREPDTLIGTRFPVVDGERVRAWPAPGWARPTAAVGAGGRLALGGFDGAYRVLITDPDGRPLRQLCREADPLPVTPEERGRNVPSPFGELAAAIEDAPRPPRYAAYGRLILGARGRLWVQRERMPAVPGRAGLYGEPGAEHDVFDRSGEFLGTVVAPEGARLQAAAGDTVWAYEVGDLDEVRIVAYELIVE